MDHNVHMRLKWVRMYHNVLNVGIVCHRCGISRPTLRKLVQRFDRYGEAGLSSLSRRPY